MSSPNNADYTPESGGAPDVAPLGRSQPKPFHELTAAEDGDPVDWDAIAATEDFKSLIKAKVRFIVPASIFFCVYYFALPVLVGFAPDFMKTKIGPANLAYVFALSQFFMAWILAYAYTRVAAKWDRRATDIIEKHAPKGRS